MLPPDEPLNPGPTFDEFGEMVPHLRAVYRKHADAEGYLSTDDYKNDPVLCSLHPAFRDKLLTGVPRLGQWNKRNPQLSGLIWLRTVGNNTFWRLQPWMRQRV